MDFNDKQSIYLQIVDFLNEQILLERWQSEERIPSVRELASMVEVNPNTVMRSFEFLQQQEVIYNKRGIGYFVAPNAKELIIKYRRARFMENELPLFFKSIYLLEIDFEEILHKYEDFKAKNYSDQNQNIK